MASEVEEKLTELEAALFAEFSGCDYLTADFDSRDIALTLTKRHLVTVGDIERKLAGLLISIKAYYKILREMSYKGGDHGRKSTKD